MKSSNPSVFLPYSIIQNNDLETNMTIAEAEDCYLNIIEQINWYCLQNESLNIKSQVLLNFEYTWQKNFFMNKQMHIQIITHDNTEKFSFLKLLAKNSSLHTTKMLMSCMIKINSRQIIIGGKMYCFILMLYKWNQLLEI